MRSKKRFTPAVVLIAAVLLLLTAVALLQFPLNAAATNNETYKVEIVSFIRGQVEDLRCSELLEARIYKSTDGGTTWEVATDVKGTPVSKLTYTWTNDSPNTPMVVFLTHDMTKTNIWGDTKEQTFQDGVSSTAVGGQWASLKTPGVNGSGIGMPGIGMPGFPGMGNWPMYPGGGSSSSSRDFSGSVTVQVRLPNGDLIRDTYSEFGRPNLEADLNTIALGLFEGESKTMLELLGESGIVHINCDSCRVTDIRITDPSGCVQLRQSTVTGVRMGEATLRMTVDKEGCTVHNGQTADVSTGIFVFRKPKTSTTTTTLTLAADSLDSRCEYYIDGVKGTAQADGSILFSGLTPDTDYTVDVVATYRAQNGNNTIVKYAYAYVEDTTKPVYTATVNTYLDGSKTDVTAIHGDGVSLYLKEQNGTEYIPLGRTGAGTYRVGADNGVYDVYHKEGNDFHKINENHLIVANRAGSVDVHHYTVTYDPAGGAFADGEAPDLQIYASGKTVTAVKARPSRAGHKFLGWSYGTDTVAPEATVTEAITAPITLTALWEREINVSVNITIDHTYTDPNGNTVTDSNNDSKDDVSLSLVARDGQNKPYLEVPNGNLTVSESSHGGHTLFVNGTAVENYAEAGTANITDTRYEEDATPSFTGLSAGKEYFVTVAKAGYDSYVTAEEQANGDWVINVTLKFAPESEELAFEVIMDGNVPAELYPKAVIVKVLYYNTVTGSWDVIAQHANGNPGVRVPIVGQSGNVGSFPVWIHESGETTPYYYRIAVSAFIYQDDTIVSSEETERYVEYTDKNYTATVSNVVGGALCGNLNGAFFGDRGQQGILDATITLEAYDVTFRAEGGEILGADSAVAPKQYYIPDFVDYQPAMTGHTFLGWWYRDANGNYTEKAEAGEILTEDITLYALWDQTLEGAVQIDGTYENNGNTVPVWENDRADRAMIILQEITSDTVNNLEIVYVPVTWSGDVGTSGAYRFEGLDPMKDYRIEIIVTNYTSSYQNSTTPAGTFRADDYKAIYTDAQPWETFVNGKLSFEPESYLQDVEVDASQIGKDFRPNSVMTQIWYTERGTYDPYKVITQHADGGLKVLLGADGKQNGTYAEVIWKEKFNGNLYDYQAYVSDTAVQSLPVTILYGPHSNFDTVNGQARNPLTVTLVPNRYDIIFDLNTGSEEDLITAYEAHVWSHATPITAAPTRDGYVFIGWKATEEGVYADGEILASVSKTVTLEAQWEKATLSYKVEYYFDGQLKKTDTLSARFEDVVNPAFEQKTTFEGKNYALDSVVGTPLTVGLNEGENVIKVYYGTDNLSDEADQENTPDGIPDKYQKKVTFKVVNGTWKDGTAQDRVHYLTLMTDNRWDVNGTAVLASESGMIAANGYGKGAWDVTPPAVFRGTNEEVYTFAFEKVILPPPTHDGSYLALSGLLLLSGFGAAAAVLFDRKRKTNGK